MPGTRYNSRNCSTGMLRYLSISLSGEPAHAMPTCSLRSGNIHDVGKPYTGILICGAVWIWVLVNFSAYGRLTNVLQKSAGGNGEASGMMLIFGKCAHACENARSNSF